MNQASNQQLYFQSSNEELQYNQSAFAKQALYEKSQSQINSMQGQRILDILFDSASFHKILQKYNKSPQILEKFIWRAHYLLGETVLSTQNFLYQDGLLKDCLLLDRGLVETIAHQIIEKAKKVPVDQPFIKLKILIDQYLKYKDFDAHKLMILYSEFVKLSRKTIQFEMALVFPSIEEELKTKNSQLATSNNMSAQINEQYNQSNTQTNTQHFTTLPIDRHRIKPHVIPPKIKQSVKSNPPGGMAAGTSYQIEKGGNKKWSPTQQAIFCKIYSETDSPLVCVQLMEKQAGADSRWKTPIQIQEKMCALATKVFNKFQSLPTNNQIIKIFRENRKIALNCQQNIKKTIFRNIAIIYESMLNASEQKKAVISQKILEINRLCKDATHMK